MSNLLPILLVTILLLVVASGIIMMVLVYQKKQIQFSKDKAQLKADYEKEILENRLEMQEQTMKKISQEIHDNIGQILSLAKLTINSIDSNGDSGLQNKIANSANLVGKAIQDLRELAKSLQSDEVFDKGLWQSIADELSVINKASNYKTFINLQGNPFELPKNKEFVIFRMFQEAVNNIIKHAKASTIQVDILYSLASFQICIKDDGLGFDFESLLHQKTSTGIGLRNIQSRATVIGAKVTIQSCINQGTLVEICLPMNEIVSPKVIPRILT